MNLLQSGAEFLRQIGHKMFDKEQLARTQEWNNRNVWNDPALTVQDQLAKELPNKNITEHKC